MLCLPPLVAVSDVSLDDRPRDRRLGGHAVLGRGQMPGSFEPGREGRAGLVEGRARGQAGLVTTGAAREAAPARPPGLTGRAAGRADEAVPPAQRLDVAQARLFAGEHLDEGPVRCGIVDAGNEATRQVKLIRWSVHHYILG